MMWAFRENIWAWALWWGGWAFRLGLSALFIWNATRGLSELGTAEDLVSMTLPAMWGVLQLVLAGLTLGYSFAGWISRPILAMWGTVFHPQDWFREPPESLLRGLRVRIRDRHHGAVDQQTRGLLRAYGPRAEVYHLLVLNVAADGGIWEPVAEEARKAMGRKRRMQFEALLAKDPPGSLVRNGR